MPLVRDTVRALRAAPVVTAVAILSLALGIGANTSIFSMVDALLLRSLPVPEPERLALLTTTSGRTDWTNPIWEQIRDRPRLFAGATAWSAAPLDLSTSGQTDLVDGIFASGSFFDVLRVPAIIGRTFGPADDRRDGGASGPTAVISYSFWRRRYGASPSAVGKSLTLNGVRFTIIGVSPPEFFGAEVGRTFDVAVPLGARQLMYGAAGGLDSRSSWWLSVMVRLEPAQSVAAATSIIQSLQPRLREATLPLEMGRAYRDAYLTDRMLVRSAAGGTSSLRARYARPLFVLLSIVALVLLIACGNIANLQLARAMARRHELSVRTALGATRATLARQLLAESAILSGAGAVMGVALAYWGCRLLISQLSTANARVVLDVGVDWRMLGFTAAVATLTTMLFGTAPAIWATNVHPIDALRQRADNGRAGRFGLGGVLVIGQLGLSLLLLVGAGAFVRSFSALSRVKPGFDAEGILIAHVDLQPTAVAPRDRAAAYARLGERVATIPGVAHSAMSFRVPVCGCRQDDRIEVPGAGPSPADRTAWFNTVTPGWFAAYRTPVRSGRDFDARDRLGAPLVAVVNEAFAKKFFDGRNPVGRTVLIPTTDTSTVVREIVGLVGDAMYRSVKEAAAPPTVYLPLAQRENPWTGMDLSVRGTGEPARLIRSVAAAVTEMEPRAKLTFRILSETVSASLIQERQLAMLSGFFAALALLLSAIGLYGVTSYAVNRRRVEIGIRMALGTTPADVVRLVLERVGRQLVFGSVIGLVAVWWTSRFVAQLIYGLTPADGETVATAVLTLLVVGGLAAFVPARRAAKLDPMRVL
ncbi:MAG TPA: ABC transporter permease [Gemmatimonadaceae bacterium]|jgi:predicted permease|nr:ABC transporter permease [Gemmatimonadaceae bacterium]